MTADLRTDIINVLAEAGIDHSFSRIIARLKLPSSQYRRLDTALQALRKEGTIAHSRARGWHLVPEETR